MSEGFPNRPVPRPFQPRVPNNNGSHDNSNNAVNNNPVNAPRPVPHNAGNVSNARFNPGAGVNPVIPVQGNNGQVHANPQRVAPLRPAVPLHDARRVNEDEFFTDTFCYYQTDYKMFGFSDFTALAKNYREGGVLPQVVAIHLAYQKNEDEVYIHHFLSDTKNGSDDIRNEFEEAKGKIMPFFEGKATTLAIRQLVVGGYPGLGAIKKYSIKNHFELMSRILHEKED